MPNVKVTIITHSINSNNPLRQKRQHFKLYNFHNQRRESKPAIEKDSSIPHYRTQEKKGAVVVLQ